MKKAIIVLVVSFICIAVSPAQLSADEGSNKTKYHSYPILEEINANPVFEMINGEEGSNMSWSFIRPRAVGAVINCILSIYTGISMIVEAYIWIEDHQTPSDAITAWVINNYNTSNYSVNSMKVVYDTGCWKPEFPNNPFCRLKVADSKA